MRCSTLACLFVSLSLAVVGSGCGLFFGGISSGTSGGTTAGDGDGDGDTDPLELLEECRGDASDAEVLDTIAIKDDYSDSLHELVACGGLNARLCSSLISGILDAVMKNEDSAMPPGWGYVGNGVYHTEGTGVTMDTQFFLAEDFEFGNKGDVITQNLFLASNYLDGYYAYIDYQGIVIEYDAPGPLVELMGYGTNPPNPIVLDLDDYYALNSRLKKLEFTTEIIMDDERDLSTVQYHITSPRIPANGLLDGTAQLQFDLHQADAFRTDLGQQLTVDSWGVEYGDTFGALDGTIDFHVSGQHFDWAGRFTYEQSGYPQEDVYCPPR
jgi:hypothetical protein